MTDLQTSKTPTVVRSVVQPDRPYGDYREILRYDFWFSCAYCSMSENEARGISFEIDHHRPQSDTAERNIHRYDNLMWSCSACNLAKSAIWPSEQEIAKGYRYLRPDVDILEDNYSLEGLLLRAITTPGEYTITVLNLNRQSQRDIRKLRARLGRSATEIMSGLQALISQRLDALKPIYRAQFRSLVDGLQARISELDDVIEQARQIRLGNASPLLTPDLDHKKTKLARREYLKAIRAISVNSFDDDRDDEVAAD